MHHDVSVKAHTFGPEHPLFLIGGPCVIEDLESTLGIARAVASECRSRNIPYVFKSSFDKANRTSLASPRGPGLNLGLEVLQRVKDELGLPVLVDVHDADQLDAASRVADILQIPAFLCRQTDFVQAVARTRLPVNIKKGQFLAPWDLTRVIEKIEATGNRDILLTERGVCFGYNNLVVDFRSFPILAATGYPVIFDATHSVQLPGGRGDATGGQREFIRPLARAAVAAGVDGLFMEIHPDPKNAPCDADCMLPLAWLPEVLDEALAIRKALGRP